MIFVAGALKTCKRRISEKAPPEVPPYCGVIPERNRPVEARHTTYFNIRITYMQGLKPEKEK